VTVELEELAVLIAVVKDVPRSEARHQRVVKP
jgi:hypothetical protein